MDLKDYSGDYVPGLKYEDFSKDILKKVFAETANLYVMIDGVWVGRMREKLGEEETTKISAEIWAYILEQEAKRMAKVFNIRTGPEATVVDFLKLFHVTPGYGLDKYPQKAEIINENHAYVTFCSCASLLYYERHNLIKPGKLPGCCAVEMDAVGTVARVVNPAIQFRPLKRGPRSGPNDIFCKWEFKIETAVQSDTDTTPATAVA